MNKQELKELIYQGEKVDIECKKAEKNVPKSAYESYSAFANTKGGYIILGVREDKTKTDPKERFIIQGIEDAPKQKEDFWNTINGNKVNINLLTDDDVKIVEDGSISLIVIHVPRADFNMRPVYVGENPYKGTYKRNHEGDYHATEHEIRGMITTLMTAWQLIVCRYMISNLCASSCCPQLKSLNISSGGKCFIRIMDRLIC